MTQGLRTSFTFCPRFSGIESQSSHGLLAASSAARAADPSWLTTGAAHIVKKRTEQRRVPVRALALIWASHDPAPLPSAEDALPFVVITVHLLG